MLQGAKLAPGDYRGDLIDPAHPQADYGLEALVRDMNVRGAQLARQAADEAGGRYVAGSVGPLNVSLSLSPNVDDPAFRAATSDQVKAAYEEQIAALAEGGVDLLL